jgi:hypothetical protein
MRFDQTRRDYADEKIVAVSSGVEVTLSQRLALGGILG